MRFASRTQWILGVAFLVLLVLPLYALTAVVVARSGILRLSGGDLTDEQFKSMWTFIASGLATCATVLAAILTKSHNDRSLALQADAEAHKQLADLQKHEIDVQKQALEDEAADRLKLETVIAGLKLMSSDGKPSKAVTAGGLATLVRLGHPLVAMRVLTAALDGNDEVDADAAAWVLDQGLRGRATEETREEAAALLYQHASTFTDIEPGFFHWPSSVDRKWEIDVSPNAGYCILSGLVELLVSRTFEWWDNTWQWSIFTLDEAMRNDSVASSQAGAATLATELLNFVHDTEVLGRPKSDIANRARDLIEKHGAVEWLDLDSVRRWGTEHTWSKDASPGRAASASISMAPERGHSKTVDR